MGFWKPTSILKLGLRCISKDNSAGIMKYLNVAEKNDAAKNIASLLSRGNSNRRNGLSPYNKIYEFDTTVFGHPARMVMTSVSGHLLNCDFTPNFRNWQSCNPLTLFDAPVVKHCSQDKQRIKQTLEREIRSCQGLIIWTDCDREGENIGFEIIKVCTDVKPNVAVYRAKFSEITAASVFRALNNLGQPDKNVSDAVDVRQELDLRTGAAFTRLQTLRLQRVFPQALANKLISYGSCQFPTLGFVVERFKEIEEFVPEPFWKIKMNHQIKELVVDYTWKRDRLFNKNACEALLDICMENPSATVEQVESKSKSKWRPLPLDTIELEKTVSRKLKINAKETMKIAERLYTLGFISYPRTETNIFSKDINLVPLVEQQCEDNRWGPFAQRILYDGGPNPRQGRKSDQAHPPIHPIKYTNNLTGKDQKIYEYIVRHFLACVSKDAVGFETVVHADIADEKFFAKGLVILEKNYLEVYPYEKWNAKEIHEYQIGTVFLPSELSLSEGSTTAPKPLTEADLIAVMEKHGIGTDATHADHIDTIKSREYVGLHENIYFVPGTLGMGLVEGYNNIGLDVSLAKPILRSEFEKDLKLICEGRKRADTVKHEQIEKYKAVFRTVMEKMIEIDRTLAHRLEVEPQQITHMPDEEFKSVLKCPKCGNDMVLRNRKNGEGKYIGCVGYPACKNSIWLPMSVENVKVLDESCGDCGSDVKKLEIKFKRNPFPGEPNPNTFCIGGCDSVLLDILNIRLESVRKPNVQNMRPPLTNNGQNVNVQRNVPAAPNQQTLNNWINRNDSNRNNNQSVNDQNTNRNTRSNNNNNNNDQPGSSGSNKRSYSTFSSDQTSFGNSNRSSVVNDSNMGNNRWTTRSFLDTNIRTNGGNTTILPTCTSNSTNVSANNVNSSYHNNSNWVSSNNTNGSFNSEEKVVCNCNNEAILLTVKKEGPNTGRRFYKCQVPNGGCNFFKWASEDAERILQPNVTNTSMPGPSSTRPGPSSIQILCNCNLPAVERRVTKQGPTNGRIFFCCPKPIGEGCNFFKWADEDEANNTNHGDDNDGGGGGGSGGGGFNQSWNSGNTSRGNGSTGSSWKMKHPKRSKNKTVSYKTKKYKNNKSNGTKENRKCGLCREAGHIRTNCPNTGT